MAKLTAWLVTIIGLLMVLAQFKLFALTDAWVMWIISLAVLAIGIGKFIRNYKK